MIQVVRMGRICPRRWDMKQKLSILLFFAFGLVVWYFVFTDEGQELGEDFVAWIDDIIKF